jgi:hypothetical protein
MEPPNRQLAHEMGFMGEVVLNEMFFFKLTKSITANQLVNTVVAAEYWWAGV